MIFSPQKALPYVCMLIDIIIENYDLIDKFDLYDI